MLIFDRVPVGETSLTEEGYLAVPSRISRTGIQEYYGYEFGIEPADKLFRWHRPADEVFSPPSLKSFMLKPVTIGHPYGGVTAATWKDLAVGSVGLPYREEDHVRADLLITSPEAINEVQRGMVELSCGYDCELDFTPGVTDDGEPYDGVMRKIRGNHVAIVPKGRCGPSCKIGDEATGGPRLVMLSASVETQKKLRAWALAAGFDLSKSFSGKERDPEAFDFHLTLFATRDRITLPTGRHEIPPISLPAAFGFEALGNDADTPVLSFGTIPDLERLRGHYLQTYKARPTFSDFKPHISLSYAWAGSPDLASLTLPSFPIVLDAIVVDDFDAGDPPMPTANDCAGKPRCSCASKPQGDQTMTKTVTIDGATFEVADEKLAAAIKAADEKNTKLLADVKGLLNDATAALADMKAKQEAADKAAADAKAAQEAAEKAKPTDADIARMANERAAVIVDAKKIAPDFEPGDKSIADIRAGVVAKKLGDAAVKDRSADYVAAQFDLLASTAKDEKAPASLVFKSKDDNGTPEGRKAYDSYLENAWKGPDAK